MKDTITHGLLTSYKAPWTNRTTYHFQIPVASHWEAVYSLEELPKAPVRTCLLLFPAPPAPIVP